MKRLVWLFCMSILNVKDAGMRMVSIRFVGADACRRPLQMFFKAIPHNSKCRYGERGAAAAVPQLPERCLSRKAGIVRCCHKRRYSGNHLILLYLTLHAERTNRHQYQSPAAAYPFLGTAGGAAGRILTAGLPCTTLRLPLCRRRQNPAYSPSGNPVSG